MKIFRLIILLFFLKFSASFASDSLVYCGNGFKIEFENECLVALLEESQGVLTFKERRWICESKEIKLNSSYYKNITDFILKARVAKELKPCL